jgi:hypothetical protein
MMTVQPINKMMSLDNDKCDFIIKCLRDEITSQANTFDQIDNKTGVAMGFTFVAVGQVLASVFRMSTDQNHFKTLHPCAVGGIFLFANICVIAALICGVGARWPREFVHSLDWNGIKTDDTLDDIKKEACHSFLEATKNNDKINGDKAAWASWTYRFVGLALFLYLLLTLLLYWFSIPR